MAQVLIDDGVITSIDEPRLIGSRCDECGNHMFPQQGSCPRCTSTSTSPVELETGGTLWTWTVQGYPPKAPPYKGDADPKTFQPFGVGYVELPGQVKVETRLTLADPDQLEIGMPMELTLVPLYTNDDGDEVMTFAFAPSQSAGDAGDQNGATS